jgi:PAS domain S-box-containing protein
LANDVRLLGIQLKKHVQDIDAHYVERARLAEDALKRRQLVESIFTNMLSGLVVFDHQGKILSANPRAANFFKLRETDLIGRHVNDIFGPFPKMLDLIVGGRDHPDPVLSSINMKLPDGQTIYFETTRARLVSETDPGEKKILFIFRDVTKRKTMEAQLNRSNRLVSMGILAAGIAHEIRNPLTGISLMLDDLHDRMATRTEERLMMESALKEIEKLDAIISELLAFASKSTTNPRASDLNHVVNLTLFFVQKQYKKARIALNKNLCASLPPIQVDTEKMKQALLNILLNALAALSEQDNGEVVITTAFSPTSDILGGKPAVILSVRDNGPGIAQKDLEFIFDPFYTKKAGGFGLGLSITHTIIEEHTGKILAESEAGSGACFTIYLPADDPAKASPAG